MTIGPIHCEGDTEYVQGYAVTSGKGRGAVRINPEHDVVDTAIHELIHRLKPKWSERKVRAQTKLIMRSLSPKEIDLMYQQVLSTAVVRKRPLVIEAD